MTRNAITNLVLHHKAFLVSYVWWSGVAVFMVFVAIVFAVESLSHGTLSPFGPPQGSEPITSAADHNLPLQSYYFGDPKVEANLSPAQWKEIQGLLKVIPSVVAKVNDISVLVANRSWALGRYADFAFTHLDKLSQPEKDAWRELQLTKEIDYPMEYQCQKMRESFVTRTLTIENVEFIVHQCYLCETLEKDFDRRNALIDRYMAGLVRIGLHPGPLPEQSLDDSPHLTFSQYLFALHYQPKEVVEPKLPELTFTMNQVVEQLDQPQLSKGATSLERAVSEMKTPSQLFAAWAAERDGCGRETIPTLMRAT